MCRDGWVGFLVDFIKVLILIDSSSPEFVDVYYKNNVAQGSTMQSYYMVSQEFPLLLF